MAFSPFVLPIWFSSIFSHPSALSALKPRAWLQPEELTLLLIQLRRHQAKMAGVHSPSDAFAHLQHHQHNGLLGPSMQVRGPHTSLTSSASAALCNPLPVHCGPLLPSQTLHITSLSFITVSHLSVLLGCLVYSTISAWGVLYFRLSRLPLSYTLVLFTVGVAHCTY